jgi:signal transduction histidine kinase
MARRRGTSLGSDPRNMLIFFTKEEHAFSAEEVKFLTTLTSQAAIAIYNSQLYEEMSRSNKIKDEFLNVISHELRTPINVVMGYAQLLNDGTLGENNPRQAAAIGTIAGRSRDLLDMVNSLLYATSLEGNGAKLEAGEVSLKDFILELETEYQFQSNNGITVSSSGIILPICQPSKPTVRNLNKFYKTLSTTPSSSPKEALSRLRCAFFRLTKESGSQWRTQGLASRRKKRLTSSNDFTK